MARKQSDATALRHVKRMLREEVTSRNQREEDVARIICELNERRRIGSMMSNICYNLAQKHPDEQVRNCMDACRKAWDGIPKGVCDAR